MGGWKTFAFKLKRVPLKKKILSEWRSDKVTSGERAKKQTKTFEGAGRTSWKVEVGSSGVLRGHRKEEINDFQSRFINPGSGTLK